jgi:hypothetical protein
MAKMTMKEDGADNLMKHHLSMWQTLSVRAKGNLTFPDINQLENIKAD